MIEVIDFKAEHLTYLLETGIVDKKLKPFFTEEHGPALEKLGGVLTVLDSGIPIAVGGIRQFWKNRGEAWLIFGKPRTENFVVIFRMVNHILRSSTLKRIEMVIDYEFEQGHRWARLLGFKKEAEILRAYRPDGGDATLYAMVRV